MKRNTKTIISVMLLGTLLMAGCGGKDAYTDYNNAYKKTASPGSLNVEFSLTVDSGDGDMDSSGNMKMNNKGEVYYEMEINGKEIMQYVEGGQVHTFVDGQEQITFTSDKNKGAQKADPDGGQGRPNEKTDGTSFNTEKFMEEFSGFLEAGKIKEMGVLDPIPSKYIKEITVTEQSGKKIYTMIFPDEFLQILLNAMIAEQVGDNSNGVQFSNLKDFTCVSKENTDGYLNYIQYKGYTTVTVPADYMADGKEKSFDLSIDLEMDIVNPGTAVDVIIPD